MKRTEQEKAERRIQIKKRREEEDLIKSQLWKADQVARKISAMSGLPVDELRQQACEYILSIYRSWDQSKGANFSTWINRNLSYHMFNYLRDSSRLVKIPRSYSDLNLKMRKLVQQNPSITSKEMAKILKVSATKVESVQEAFAMSFTEITEYNQIEEDLDMYEPSEGVFCSYKECLDRIAELPESDELFLVDHIIKKRSVSTLVRKNPHLKGAKDIDSYAEKLIKQIVCEKQ
jgi:DNA-directed RNA polymerase specialized sigma subunit